MNKIGVLIADDHTILRSGIKSLLAAQPDIQVVAEAGTTAELVARARETHPDVILLDLSMPEAGGLKALEELRAGGSQARCLALTMHDEASYVLSAMAAGVSGYLLKSTDLSELSTAIRAVYKGLPHIDSTLRRRGLESLMLQRPEKVANVPAGGRLSQREREVLQLLALGHTYRAIAESLHLSPKSVETYRSRLTEKLGTSSRAGLVRYAIEMDLLRAS